MLPLTYVTRIWKSVISTVTRLLFSLLACLNSRLSFDCLLPLLLGHGDQLLQYKADINAVNEHGNVPLHYACFWGQDQVAEVSAQALSPGMDGEPSLSLKGRF